MEIQTESNIELLKSGNANNGDEEIPLEPIHNGGKQEGKERKHKHEHKGRSKVRQSKPLIKLTFEQQVMEVWKSFQQLVRRLIDHSFFVATMSIFTIWALFSDDIRLSGTSKDADNAFQVVITLAFALFLFEIVAQSICKEDYLVIPDSAILPEETIVTHTLRRLQIGSFYFWLDWVATLSLLFEVYLIFLLVNLYCIFIYIYIYILHVCIGELGEWRGWFWRWCIPRRRSCRSNHSIGANGSIGAIS
jgi:hypothetical protein